jgi:hypothetical protein
MHRYSFTFFHVVCLQVATASLNQAWRQEEAPSSKQQRLGLRISHLDMSWLGCVLVATDTQGQLYLYRLLPISEPGIVFMVAFLGFQMCKMSLLYTEMFVVLFIMWGSEP